MVNHLNLFILCNLCIYAIQARLPLRKHIEVKILTTQYKIPA